MKAKLLAAVAVVGLASPALAAFYVVQDNSSKACSITEQLPSGSSMQVIGGNNRSFQTRAEAEAGMKAEPSCQSGTTGANPRPATPSSPSAPAR